MKISTIFSFHYQLWHFISIYFISPAFGDSLSSLVSYTLPIHCDYTDCDVAMKDLIATIHIQNNRYYFSPLRPYVISGQFLSSSIHLAMSFRFSFFCLFVLTAEYYSMCKCRTCFLKPHVDGQILAIVNRATMSMEQQVSLWENTESI